MRSRRSKLDIDARHAAALAVAEIFRKSSLCKNALHIACYFASGYELDMQPLIHTIWQEKKHCYLPILCSKKEAALSFVLYQERDELKLNKFNIFEPHSSESNVFPLEKLDIVFLPLLAYDLQGHRLGSGGGYYDRTFYSIKQTSKKPLLIGLSFSQQQVETLPHDDWDVLLDGVLTQDGLHVFIQQSL